MAFPTFKKKEDIPKGFEESYHEVDGTWELKLPENKDAETLVKVRAEKKEVEKAAKLAADKVAELQRQLDAKEASGKDTDVKVSEMLAKWEKDKNDAVQAKQTEIDALNGRLRSITLDDVAKSEFLKAGGRPDKADAALKLKKELLDLAEDRPVVKNAKGEVTTTTLADFWGKDFKKEMPEFFAGTKATGAGAGGGAGANPVSGDPAAVEALIKNPLAALQRANEKAAA